MGLIYTNAAIVKGGEKEKETPPVEIEVKETHSFEIKKEQKIAGEGSFTTAKLSSEAGKKVEYRITVTNTGNTTLKFSALTDTKCSNVLPAGETTLKAKEAETFTCEHTLGEADENPYKNSATIEANKEPKTSNTVEVEIKKPNFEILKEQRLKGEVGYTKAKLTGEVGETVEYKITVKNTGNTTLKFEAVKDAKCTNFSPALAAFELAPGAEQVYTCEHVLVEGDGPVYTNAAIVKGGEKEKETPPVEIEVKETQSFEIKKEQRIAGEGWFTTAKLSSEAGEEGRIQDHGHEHREHDFEILGVDGHEMLERAAGWGNDPESQGSGDVHVRTHARWKRTKTGLQEHRPRSRRTKK